MEPITTVIHGLSTLLAIAAFGYGWNAIIINGGVRTRAHMWYYVADWAMANGDAATLRTRNRAAYNQNRGAV